MERLQAEYSRLPVITGGEKSPLPESIVNKLHSEARARLVARFGEGSSDKMTYHALAHTNSMARRAQIIAEIMRETSGGSLITGRDLQLVDIITSWHDVVQDNVVLEEEENFTWEGKEYTFSKKKRKRDYGGNEKKSARELSEFVDQVEAEYGEYFSEGEKALMDTAIDATVPLFDPVLNTVRQANLGTSPEPVVLAVAMGDLATAPMEGKKRFLEEGIALFKEDNVDIEEGLLLISTKQASYQAAWGEYIRKRMIDKQVQQLGFVTGRQALFETDIATLPKATQIRLRETFRYFDESIAAQADQIEASRDKPIQDLLSEYGYLD